MTVELDGIISGTPQAATKTKIVCTLGPKVRHKAHNPFCNCIALTPPPGLAAVALGAAA